MKNIISSLKRKRIKNKTISTILNSDQKNDSVVNLHRIDKNNVGDFYCAPHLYFDVLKDKSLDIFDYKVDDKNVTNNFIEKISNNSLIIGGGGLLNRSGFSKQMKMFEKLTDKNKKIVLWGLGHNRKDPSTFNKKVDYNINISRFGLVGTRDYSMPGEYVPCVSCMHSIFDKDYSSTQETGIIFHKDTLKKNNLLKRLENYPTSSNTTNLEEMVGFIGKSETIVTDSYHAMYWSLLLNKKVVAIPNSSKFYDFKYKPVFSSFDNFEDDIKKGHSYSGILEECREINHKFADKVFNYLNL
ncbi:polysaccharide pyruvyl transferase family protein [Winogradskyella sp. HB-48]|uniref:polysaccharide pyruvyl transferase family protein n=1 Tax=Winogradskyella sp. HB-48 TaxID=3416808 RepID=UPI003CF3FE7A